METTNEKYKEMVNNPSLLNKFRDGDKITACIYPKPFDKAEIVRWFYSRNNSCQVFFACSKEVSDKIEEDSWADISWEFTVFVEHELMPFCVENTDWTSCHRYMIDYDCKAFDRDEKGRFLGSFDMGCSGTACHCEPFGEGDFTYGIAEQSEFILTK